MSTWSQLDGPVLLAHRGARTRVPENSLPAFQLAFSQGADVIETDAHMTQDGHVVLCHDPGAERTAGVARAIRECRLEEVKGWVLGRDSQGQAISMPTLAEALEACPDGIFNLDLKQASPSMVGPTCHRIEQMGASQRVLLTSFDRQVVQSIRAGGYRGPVGMCQAEAIQAFFLPELALRLLPLRGVRLQVPPKYGPLRLGRPNLIDKMHRLGVKVDFWVVNDPQQARRLLDMGADGIVTDEPEVMARLYREHDRTGPWRRRHPA